MAWESHLGQLQVNTQLECLLPVSFLWLLGAWWWSSLPLWENTLRKDCLKDCLRGREGYGPEENYNWLKRLPYWALLLNMLGSALGAEVYWPLLGIFPEAQITGRGSQNIWKEAGAHPHPPQELWGR